MIADEIRSYRSRRVVSLKGVGFYLSVFFRGFRGYFQKPMATEAHETTRKKVNSFIIVPWIS